MAYTPGTRFFAAQKQKAYSTLNRTASALSYSEDGFTKNSLAIILQAIILGDGALE
jgi:hypothetical protein